jgi:fused signal recognition particle receptor
MAKKQEQEIAVVTVQAQALLKVNVTEAVLAQLEKDYTGLKIAGVDDKEGIARNKAARKVCRDWRILADRICKEGRENAVKEQKSWLEAGKKVISRIEAVEMPLKEEDERISAEIEAVKTAKKEAESRMIAERILSFSEVAAVLDYDTARDMSTSEYNDTLEGITAEYNAKKEAERVEAERVEAELAESRRIAEETAAREAEERAEADRLLKIEQDKVKEQQAEIARQFAELKAAQDAVNAAKEAEEREKQKAMEIAEAEKRAATKAKEEAEDKAKRKEDARIAAESAEKQRIAKEKAEVELKAAQAPDKEKLFVLSAQIESLFVPVMATASGKKIAGDVAELLLKVTAYITEKAKDL